MAVQDNRIVHLERRWRQAIVLACLMLATASIGLAAGASFAGGTSASSQPTASHLSSRGTHIELQVVFLQREVATLKAENTRLAREVDGLTREHGVIDTLIAHVRRIDGEGRALRTELGALFTEGPPLDADPSPYAMPVPGARHQLVTEAAGRAPSVTSPMGDGAVGSELGE